MAQVLAALQVDGLGGLGLSTASREMVGDAVLVDRDQADRAGAGGSPRRVTIRAIGRPMRPLGPVCSASTNSPFLAPRGVGTDAYSLSGPCRWAGRARPRVLAEDAEDAVRDGRDAADHPGLVLILLAEDGHQAPQEPVAGPECRIA